MDLVLLYSKVLVLNFFDRPPGYSSSGLYSQKLKVEAARLGNTTF